MSLKIIGAAAALAFVAAQTASSPAAAGENEDNLVKAAIGLAAIGMIASEVKRGKKAKAAAAAAAASAAKAKSTPPICSSPYWDGSNWRNNDNRICIVTPQICMRETRKSGRNIVIFDADCMWREGFRLSARY